MSETVLRFVRLCLLFIWVVAGCNSDPTNRPPAPLPANTPTPPAPAVPTMVDMDQPIIEAGHELARLMARWYQDIRNKVSAVGGSTRYVGNVMGFFQFNVSFSEYEAGFRSFEYKLECDVPEPPVLCAVARAFSPADVEAIRQLVDKLKDNTPLEFRVIGRADPVWKAPAKPKTYGGECGSGECFTDKATLQLTPGMRIDSNEVLACLRALCVYSESGIDGSKLVVRLRGAVVEGNSQPESRRAEVALYHKFTKKTSWAFWDTFLPAVGHGK